MNTGTAPTGNGDTIVFPNAFPNACLGVVVSEAAAAGWAGGSNPTIYGRGSLTAAAFSLYASRWTSGTWVASNTSYNYIALGH
jgi:hypothetical protein